MDDMNDSMSGDIKVNIIPSSRIYINKKSARNIIIPKTRLPIKSLKSVETSRLLDTKTSSQHCFLNLKEMKTQGINIYCYFKFFNSFTFFFGFFNGIFYDVYFCRFLH